MSGRRILVVDDDDRLTDMLVAYLRSRGFEADARPDVASGLARLRSGEVDALVLDLMLPDGSGLEVCKQLREHRETAGMPIIMLTALGEPLDRVVGLEIGADDYMAKPFEPRELVARLEAVMRRRFDTPPEVSRLSFGELEIRSDTRAVMLAGEPRPLTFHQFELLWELASHPGRVYSRAQLMAVLGECGRDTLERSVDVHVSRVRAAIERDPRKPCHLLTVRGVGYCFSAEPETGASS